MMRKSTHESMQNRYALITGASSGIGRHLAYRFAADGFHVLLVARRADRLEELAGEIRLAGMSATALPADLTVENERIDIYNKVTNQLGVPQVLVNNAGFGWYGYYTDMPWETAREMIQVNVSAVAHLTHLFLPAMRRAGRGHIINISSIAGSIPSQGIAVYAATKAFDDAFATSLHRELRGSPVHISVVKPGPVITEFFNTARNLPGGASVPAERFSIRVERVGDAVISLLRHPHRCVYVPGFLSLTPWVELAFGWIIDRIGPLLLKRRPASQPAK